MGVWAYLEGGGLLVAICWLDFVGGCVFVWDLLGCLAMFDLLDGV